MKLVVQNNVSLAPYTTLGVGGPADYFVVVHTVKELEAALLFAKQTAVPPLVLGGGSNVVLSDKGYRGLVIINNSTGRQYTEAGAGVLFSCGAGEVLDEAVADTVGRAYWGLENLSAIPGSVGATPIQNVGAYGVEVADVVQSVSAIHQETLEVKMFTPAECVFGYRDSYFKTLAGQKWVITSVDFLLHTVARPKLAYADLQHLDHAEITQAKIREAVIAVRAGKFPDWHTIGTVGSFFKNPVITKEAFQLLQSKYPNLPGHETPAGVKVPLGWVLDKVCGLKGHTDGAVGLFEQQALVLVAKPGATAAQIIAFAHAVIEKVTFETNLAVEREATVYDEVGRSAS